jgi:predicted GIY-YIG superfamily endonuclease
MIENTQNYKERIAEIQDVALNPRGKRCVQRQLAYQQAFSIMIRSTQLANEGARIHAIRAEEKAKQIELCWKEKLISKSRPAQSQPIDRRDRFPRKK